MSKIIIPLIWAMLIAGCQMKVEPGIRAGIDECENCGMVIQKIDQGAVAIDAEEEIHTFCNPVCLIYENNKLKESRLASARQIYLFDHEDGSPIPSGHVYLVHGDFQTAMGFGLLAFSSYDKALAFANEMGGEVIRWNDLRLGYETPDLQIILTSGRSGEPETFEASRDNKVEVVYRNRSSAKEKIILTGYDFEISIGPESEESRSFIVDKPGQGFAFQKADGTDLGMLFVEGDHTSEEAEYR